MIAALRRTFQILTIVAAFSGAALLPSVAKACPNCKLANESDSNKPRAYMYSILFMIGMPATIFTGFGISFYRMVKRAEADAALEAAAIDAENSQE